MTTGRINQVTHRIDRRIIIYPHYRKRPAESPSRLSRRPPSRERNRSTRRFTTLTTSTLYQLSGAWCGVSSELAPHFGPHHAGTRRKISQRSGTTHFWNKISKKVRYHLQSVELGPRKSNWSKKPPRTGRFFIIATNRNSKKNAAAFSIKKKTTGGQPRKKKSSARAEENPRTQTPIRCQNTTHRTEARRGTPQKTIETQSNAAEWTPVVQTVGERFNFNFFFVLPVLLLERGGCTLRAAPNPYILSGLSHSHRTFRQWSLEIFKIKKKNSKEHQLSVFFCCRLNKPHKRLVQWGSI